MEAPTLLNKNSLRDLMEITGFGKTEKQNSS